MKCTTHNDCPIELACVNHQCVNPCNLGNPCDFVEACHVQYHRPVCVKGTFAIKLSSILHFHNKEIFIILYDVFSVDSNEAECPYCPSGTLCDPSTNTCIKGSYYCQHRIFGFVLFSVFFIAIERFVNMYVLYISHVHISQIIYKYSLHTKHQMFIFIYNYRA